jgi:hypothetical protein
VRRPQRFDHAHRTNPTLSLARIEHAGSTHTVINAQDVTRELEELIAALDRRVPRVEQAGEAAIARDAAALRAKAVDRLAKLAATADRSVTGAEAP